MKLSLLFTALIAGMIVPYPRLMAQEEEIWGVKRLLEEQRTFGRILEIRDVYKLLFQGSFGGDHFMIDSSAARRSLFEEIAGLDSAATGDPLVERISKDGSVVRVNLRPFLRLGLPADSLLKVILLSKSDSRSDTVEFLSGWNNFTALVRYGIIPLPAGELPAIDDQVQRGDIRPIHHSASYVASCRPTYRVVRQKQLEKVFPEIREMRKKFGAWFGNPAPPGK
jgi:hypothetical protein